METSWKDVTPAWTRISLSVVFLFLVSLYIYSWKKLRHFKNLGIPGPKPTFLLGNLPLLMTKDVIGTDMEILKTYGKVSGLYLGVLPCMMIAEPDMIKDICVNKFHNFTNRFELIFSKQLESSVSFAKDDHWKFIRAVLSPTFSSCKLRMMTPSIHKCVENLIENITEKTSGNKTADIKLIFEAFTMDVIASTAFGIDVNSQKQPNDPFVKHAKDAMESTKIRPLLMLAMIFPSLKWLLRLMECDIFARRTFQFFESVTRAAISKRKQDKTSYRDFLQLMMNAHKETAYIKEMDDGTFNYSQYKTRGLTDAEMISNAIVFFLAGYDTTANVLTFTAYLLATNPDCQEKLIAEIDNGLVQERPSYDNVFSLQYLDMVFSEVLRMYPPLNRFNRVANKTVDINGYKISKGTNVTIAVFALHRCAEFWPDPDRFDPERFTPENKAGRHPYAYLPFGTGPRSCIGMRLAQLEAKLAIVNILQRFRFKATPETEIPPKLEKGDFTRAENGVFLKVEPRE